MIYTCNYTYRFLAHPTLRQLAEWVGGEVMSLVVKTPKMEHNAGMTAILTNLTYGNEIPHSPEAISE